MSPIDSRKNASHGELISLREYVDMRFDAVVETMKQALQNADRAVSKAEASTERRLEGMNEFRNALGDYSRQLMPRTEAEKEIQTLASQIKAVESRLAAHEGRTIGRADMAGWVVAAIATIIAVVSFLLRLNIR